MSPEQTSLSLAKRDAETALMRPPPLPKRQKRPATVVDEDAYSEALSHIIARDFFPGLAEARAQEEYLQALDSNDQTWKRDAGRKLTEAMTPRPAGQRRAGTGTRFTSVTSSVLEDTPRGYVGETPVRTPHAIRQDDFMPEKSSQIDVDMSLGAFQAKYTSEDNESFNALLDKQNTKRAQKYAFFYHSNSANSTAKRITNGSEQSSTVNDPATSALITAKGDTQLTNLEGPVRPSQDLSARPAGVEGFRDYQGPRNAFMFGPDSVEDHLETFSQRAEARSNAPPKTIQYASTRLRQSPLESDTPIAASPSLSAIDAAIAGRPKPTASEPGYTGAETPRVNGYAFVDAEPSSSELGIPVTDEEAEAAEHEAAMRLLPKFDDSGPNPFKIGERSRREDIHRKLVERADQGRRKNGQAQYLKASNGTFGRTDTPTRFSTAPGANRAGSMTPAAQRLAQKISTPRPQGNVFSDRSSVAGGWTPSRLGASSRNSRVLEKFH